MLQPQNAEIVALERSYREDRARKRRNILVQTISGIATFAVLSLWFDRRHPLANVGIALMLASIGLGMMWAAMLQARIRRIRFDVSLLEFLTIRRTQVAEAIEIIRSAAFASTLPLAVGVILYQAVTTWSMTDVALWAIVVSLVMACAHTAARRLIRTILMPELEDLDSSLRNLTAE